MTIAIRSAGGQQLSAAFKQALVDGRRDDVHAIIDEFLRREAPLGAQWRMVARICQYDGALVRARTAIDLHSAQAGRSDTALFDQAAFLAGLGDVEAAADFLRGLPADFPDIATNAHFAGTLALNMGRLDEARMQFRRALSARPSSGPSWLSLSEAMRGKDAGEWALDVVAADRWTTSASPMDRATYLYAKGAAHDALGDHDAAFAAFQAGAALVKATRPYDRAADLASGQAARTLRALPPWNGDREGRAIFVFGPPRSGTTLVEHILSAHSHVTNGGEIGLFDKIAVDIGGLTVGDLQRAEQAPGLQPLAARYAWLLEQRFGTTGRIVDKSLSVTRLAGFVAAVLPDSPLIWVRRDVLDNAWSCFRTYFQDGVEWSWDLADIAVHLRQEEQMLAHWRDVLGDRLFVLDYDALTSQPEHVIPDILDHAGLPFEEAVLRPHATARAVTTASVSQVRQPINRKGVGVAGPYRRHLQPFVDAYVNAGGRID